MVVALAIEHAGDVAPDGLGRPEVERRPLDG
jgi:hypothetical protein